MKVTLQNLGYVNEAQIDLSKDLIVLCGPNNTGKTYVSYAIYGLMHYGLNIDLIPSPLELAVDEYSESIDLIDLFLKNRELIIKEILNKFKKNISGIFASNSDLFNNTKIKLDLDSADMENSQKKILEQEIRQIIEFSDEIRVVLNKEKKSSLLSCLRLNEKNNKNAIPNRLINRIVSTDIWRIALNSLFPRVYFSPAERISVNLFAKELSVKRNLLVDQLLELKEQGNSDNPFDLLNRRATRYPLAIRANLDIADDLVNFKKKMTNYDFLATEIERDILKGKVSISKDGELQFKPDKAKTIKLPIHLSASVVKSLSSLVIYFRHLARPHDFILIDEPELNLHPDNQILVARLLAKIVNQGFKLLISTHSDYIIRELNNLISLSPTTENSLNLRKKYGYAENEVLNPEQVGVYLFQYQPRKVSSLPVTKTGFEVETIDKAIHDLNQRSEELYFQLVEDE